MLPDWLNPAYVNCIGCVARINGRDLFSITSKSLGTALVSLRLANAMMAFRCNGFFPATTRPLNQNLLWIPGSSSSAWVLILPYPFNVWLHPFMQMIIHTPIKRTHHLTNITAVDYVTNQWPKLIWHLSLSLRLIRQATLPCLTGRYPSARGADRYRQRG